MITIPMGGDTETKLNVTGPQLSALKWLLNRNGDGVVDKTGVIVAAGERAPVMRLTWNKLRDLGLVEFYLDRRRIRVTYIGKCVDLTGIQESEGDDE